MTDDSLAEGIMHVECANCDREVPNADAAQVHIIDFEVWEMAVELCGSCQEKLSVMEVKELAG